jgi:predicted DNA-binding transcriptional regulator YafY
MRADRLLSLLMLLQTRGRLSAAELASMLEVSERTIYRDIDALSAAGIPVYGEPGRGGGFDLLDSYRTSLTGLTDREVHALFMMSIPSPLTELGMSQDLQGAFLKLSAELNRTSRQEEIKLRPRIHLDWYGWYGMDEPVPFLRTIESAIWEDRRLNICYPMFHTLEMEKQVDPYGLVAKAGVWYLVCAYRGRMRVHRVSELREVSLAGGTFSRMADFDLKRFWEQWCQRMETRHSSYPVAVLAAEAFARDVPKYFMNGVQRKIIQQGTVDSNGRVRLQIFFESLEEARAVLLGFGGSLEVLEPLALCKSIEDYARQILSRYT